MKDSLLPFTVPTALAANGLVIGVFLLFWAMNGWAPETYHWSIQEDE
jgi:hypothetical protein